MTDSRPPSSRPVLLVAGAGPGVGGAVARDFARRGYDVALLGRGDAALAELAATVRGVGATADASVGWAAVDLTDEAATTAAIGRLAGETGRLDVVHFNPSAYRAADAVTITASDLLTDVALGVGALVTVVRAALPFLVEGGRVMATGSVAADQPSAAAATLGVQKAGLRALMSALDQTLSARGIRAATVTVRGTLAPHDPASALHPDRVAAAIGAAAARDGDSWTTEVAHPG